MRSLGLHLFAVELVGDRLLETTDDGLIGGLLAVDYTPGQPVDVQQVCDRLAAGDDFCGWWQRAVSGQIAVGDVSNASDVRITLAATAHRKEGRTWVEGYGVGSALSRLAPGSTSHLLRIAETLDEHLYSAQFGAEGAYFELYTGPGTEGFLGGLPDGVDPVEAWDSRVHPDDWDAMQEAYARRQTGESNNVEYRLCGFDGVTRWVSDRGYVEQLPDGTLVIDGIVSDVTARRLAEEQLEQALSDLQQARLDAELRARTDYLTGLPNRAHLAEALAAELNRADRADGSTCLALVDIDHFKAINDRYGHLAGDTVLVEVARRLRATVRSLDTPARWGGEEFAVLAPDVHSEDELSKLAERIRESLAGEPYAAGDSLISLTASIGAVSRRAPATPDDLLKHADALLYLAKQRGRNRVEIDHPATARPDEANAA